MAILAHHQGAGWTEELYQATFERAVPDRENPPAGLIAHFGMPDGAGGWHVIDVWESEEVLRRFLREVVQPAAQDLDAPPFETTVYEVRDSLIPAS
ncbi:hypothetical protein [Nonomuraea africana]|uniref:hypothetical protein n=1 Tax=Nonomuraea africana TaxID=46171 RepID=UPI00341066BE